MAIKHILVGLLMIVLASMSVAADRLFISDVDVTVGGESTKNLDQNDDGKSIGDEAVPGDEVKVSIEVKSNFTNSDKDSDGDEIAIEDVAITVTLEGVDDGDELEEEIDEFDLDPGDDDGGKVSFTIPEEVGEGDYDLIIDVEGDDTNGTTHKAQMKVTIQVEKEKHEVRIEKATISPAVVSCGKNAQLSVRVLNTGQEDEEDNTISITSEDLGLELTDSFDVDEGDFDDSMEYTKVFSIPVAKDAEEGVHTVNINVVYDDGGEEVSETADLTVDCTADDTSSSSSTTSGTSGTTSGSSSTTTSTGTTTGTNPGTTTVVVAQPAGTTTDATVIQPSETASSEDSLFDNPSFMVAIVVIEVVIVIAGIALVAYLMRRS